MGKWGKYNKTFNRAWLNDPVFSSWLQEVTSDANKARCKICKVDIRAHKSDLKKHAESSKHRQNSAAIVSQKTLKTSFPVQTLSKFELQLAVFVACHTSIQCIDHLSDILKREMPSSSSSCSKFQLRLHRTKCTALITKVVSPVLLREQVSDMHDSPFSLIIDESTDIECAKHLCLCCRYYSSSQNEIISQFLGLISVTNTTADVLYKHIKDFFQHLDLDLNNCFALATDGASSLCGCNNSVYTLMKKDIPELILVKCVCHSLHSVCSHASEELPSNIDYMLRETYNWFHRSALRRESYMDIYKLIYDGKEPLQMIPISGTRWLARSNCVKRVLDQYDALKLHFQLSSSNCEKYLSRELHAMYSDAANEVYLTFLMPILADFERVNLLFQKEHADHCSILNEL